jgi:hypothetical protein
VVVHPADLVRHDLFFAANAGHKGPEFHPVVQRNKLATLLGAENNMNKVLYVRVGHDFTLILCSVAPTALWKY